MTVLPPQGPRRGGDTDERDVRDLLGAYALDAVDDVERARVERLLRSDPDAGAEAASYAETATRLAVAASTTPPPALRARVLAEAARTRQVAPVDDRRPGPGGAAPAVRQRRAVRLLAAACGVLLAGTVGLGAALLGQDDAAPTLVASGEFAGGTAALVQVDGEYVVLGEGVPAPPSDRVYQLWSLEEGGDPVPEGFLSSEGGGLVGQVDDWPSGAVLAITEEPAGGSPQPTSDVLATVPT
ncbi:anti-sigma factor [Pseudokineococcus basanitobsidens]|uniref:Regulator of SigK n=1 Tax=Pseudokineococcus basanitobsidens TaxID=1926649 RepID=A0ABU8RJ20_9ACTN